jgi:hypothetical protein
VLNLAYLATAENVSCTEHRHQQKKMDALTDSLQTSHDISAWGAGVLSLLYRMTVDLSQLTSKVSGEVLTPDHPGYNDSIRHWASNAERRASVVVQVSSTEDIITSVFPSGLTDNSLHLLERKPWILR